MAASTTIIFVPGAWHTPHCFDKVITQLENRGYNTDRVFNASVSDTEATPDLSADVAGIQASIERALEAGQKVVVVCHSYGGAPVTEAVKADYSAAARQKLGKQGGVIRLIFCTAFLLQLGQCLLDVSAGPSEEGYDRYDGLIKFSDFEVAQPFLYNDVPEDEAKLAFKTLKGQSLATYEVPITNLGWKHVPVTYIYCTKDNAVPLDQQRMMVDAAQDQGVEIRTETIESSHSPFLSKPEELSLAIQRSAEEVI